MVCILISKLFAISLTCLCDTFLCLFVLLLKSQDVMYVGSRKVSKSGSLPSSSTTLKVSCLSTTQKRDKKDRQNTSATADEAIPVSQSSSRLSGERKRESDRHERLSKTKLPVKCGVCKNKIVDGKDEALYCEGRCQSWMHRYCAGVSKIQFEELGRSEDNSYECAACCREVQTQQIHALEDTVTALKAEVFELKTTLEQLLRLCSLKRLALQVRRMCVIEQKGEEEGSG